MSGAIVLLLTLAALGGALQGEPPQDPADHAQDPVVLMHEAKVLLPTRVFHPPDFDPQGECTLIVGFHGYGSSAERFGRTAQALADMGFLVALPESAYPLLARGELGFQWFPRVTGDEDGWRVSNLLFYDHMPSVLADLTERYSIARVYTLGFSEGTVAAMGTAIFHHEHYAGSIQFGLPLFSAKWLPGQTLPDGKSVRLLFLHGREDQRAPLSISEEAHSFFSEAGYESTLHAFEGGHTIPPDQLAVVAEWIRE